MALSNKTLIYLISISIIITLFGTTYTLNKLQEGLGITGLPTNVGGPVNLTIAATASINLSNDNITWGSGQVLQGFPNATLDTNNNSAYVVRGSWSSSGVRGFTLQNIGNVPVNVTINSTVNATSYLGGSGPAYRYEVRQATGNSSACESGIATGQNDFYPSGNTSGRIRICNVFNFTANRDHLIIDINITVPDDAPTGSKNTTIYFNACDVSSGSCAA